MMDWKNLLGTVAPWIGTAMGGPLGGMAVSAVADALGLSDKTEEAIKTALSGATPEQMLAVKKADQDFAIRMQELGFANLQKLEEIAADDRDSARKREAAVQDYTPRVLAYTIVFGFIAMAFGILFGQLHADTVLTGTVIGYLSAKAEQVAAYYFGSTANSSRKTELLAQSAPVGK
ncbi:hypothetical protein [Paludibacterium denitrificans]|uniref:hypothetical protein n=1 Tax=Paludibacterium denitrificans TaxID=2675226 RepID=UPI001E631CBC|nr:hypothetical protein [Paludibacterium denitrificans]